MNFMVRKVVALALKARPRSAERSDAGVKRRRSSAQSAALPASGSAEPNPTDVTNLLRDGFLSSSIVSDSSQNSASIWLTTVSVAT